MSYLDAHIVVRRRGHTLDVPLRADPGDVIAVIGPNGAGKSTLARALAGIVPLSDGHLTVGGRTWEAAGHSRLEARHRQVGMVFQEELLFPHLTALGNAAFGPRSRGAGRRTSDERAHAWLDRLGIADLADRRPHELSGGQAQRVSIARALAGDPDLLLLDEPLSALDVGVAMSLRLELGRHLAGFGGVAVLVTHDALDAMTLANRVLVLDGGSVAQEGTPSEVATHPRTDHVARLVGLNVLRGTSEGTSVRLADGSALVSVTPLDGAVNACFTPAAVTLTLDEPSGSARNRWRGPISSVSPHGSAVRVHVETTSGLIADVTPASAAALGLVPGQQVWASVKATEIKVYGSRS
ncbi:MAG: ABC transporter ATP-binding protein [Nocardioidaceae bacterium]|nr:ABC transporter ATP-binding protein [Nocardioidaceae bacterium]